VIVDELRQLYLIWAEHWLGDWEGRGGRVWLECQSVVGACEAVAGWVGWGDSLGQEGLAILDGWVAIVSWEAAGLNELSCRLGEHV
jgi:hypothetical protein